MWTKGNGVADVHSSLSSQSEEKRQCEDFGLTKKSVRQAYRFYAPFYDVVFGPVLDEGRLIMARAVGPAVERLLEVGVGTGLALPRYPSNIQVVGVDISLDMLVRAQKHAERREPGRTHLLCADAEQLPFADNAFDCVTLPYVLSVTPNPRALLEELRRVCRPGGQVLVLNHFSGAGTWARLERLVARFAGRIGFDSLLPMDTLDSADWSCVMVRSVNFMGLSRLVEFRNEQCG